MKLVVPGVVVVVVVHLVVSPHDAGRTFPAVLRQTGRARFTPGIPLQGEGDVTDCHKDKLITYRGILSFLSFIRFCLSGALGPLTV